MATRKRVRTVLYGDQELLAGELDLLHTPVLQRLYELHQLGLTDRVYIDASHSRLQHVVGVLHQVDNLMNAIERNVRSGRQQEFRFGRDRELVRSREWLAERVRNSRAVARLIGLLHDLTHAPYGHTLEDEIQVVGSKHDEPSRQADAFLRLICQYIGWLGKDLEADVSRLAMPGELLAFATAAEEAPPTNLDAIIAFGRRLLGELGRIPNAVAWRLPPNEIEVLLANLLTAMTALVHLESLHGAAPAPADFPDIHGYPFQKIIEGILDGSESVRSANITAFDPHVDAYLLDVVGNTVCADILDYAQRDTHFANLKLSYDADRIAENFTIAAWDPSKYIPADFKEDGKEPARMAPLGVNDPFAGTSLRAAISLFSHKLRTDMPSELMNLLNVRFYVYERVIFHPTKTAAGAMLGTALQLAGWGKRPDLAGPGRQLPPRLQFMGDAVFLHEVRQTVAQSLDAIAGVPTDRVVDETLLAELAARPTGSLSVLARDMLSNHLGRGARAVHDDLCASKELFDRLAARRYFRPVFRVMPDLDYPAHGFGADTVSAQMRIPDKRFGAERAIERAVALPTGSVVIHCPKRNTAEKIANVLLVLVEDDDKLPSIYKLQHIRRFSAGLFGAHQAAIEGVTKMYESMWRLAVFVSPPHLSKWRDIATAAGREIAHAIDSQCRTPLKNDVWLENELITRERSVQPEPMKPNRPDSTTTNLDTMTAAMHAVADRMEKEAGSSQSIRDEIAACIAEAYGRTPDQARRVADAMMRVVSASGHASSGGSRVTSIWGLVNRYVGKGLGQQDRAEFDDRFMRRLDGMSLDTFASFRQQLEIDIAGTPRLTDQRDDRFDAVLRRIEDLLERAVGGEA